MQTYFQLNHKEQVPMKYHFPIPSQSRGPNIFIQENVFEYAVWNGNHFVSTEMRFNDCIECWLKGVNIKPRETYMVYFWVTLDQCIVALILNFTGQLMNKL